MKKTLLLLILGAFASVSYGQGREFVRQRIEEWGGCKNVAITATGGDLVLNGRNGWAATGIPSAMEDKLRELHDAGDLIDDVVLTESGSWLIQYGDNDATWVGIPSGLEAKIRYFNNLGEIINSITFNDRGDWIIITNVHWAASADISDFIQDGIDNYGMLWTAHVSEDGLVLVFARGYKFFGQVPNALKTKLSETSLNVYRISFLSTGAYFFADKNGAYQYHM